MIRDLKRCSDMYRKMYIIVSTDGGGHLDSDGAVKVHGVYSDKAIAEKYHNIMSKVCQVDAYSDYQLFELPTADTIPDIILEQMTECECDTLEDLEKHGPARRFARAMERERVRKELEAKYRWNAIVMERRRLEVMYDSIPPEMWASADESTQGVIDDAKTCLWRHQDDFFASKFMAIQRRVQAHFDKVAAQLPAECVEYLKGCFAFGGITCGDRCLDPHL
jgi:hypothetical protein